jgi:hypothetical protein
MLGMLHACANTECIGSLIGEHHAKRIFRIFGIRLDDNRPVNVNV